MNHELEESVVEITVKVSIKGNYCSKNCQFIQHDLDDWCALYGDMLERSDKPFCNHILYLRCNSCKEKIPSK
jgi:hypothetical protein